MAHSNTHIMELWASGVIGKTLLKDLRVSVFDVRNGPLEPVVKRGIEECFEVMMVEEIREALDSVSPSRFGHDSL